jgi:hypothetical protein
MQVHPLQAARLHRRVGQGELAERGARGPGRAGGVRGLDGPAGKPTPFGAIRAGLERRRAQGKPVGRQPGAADKKPRKRSGYVASWENGRRRAAHDASTVRQEVEAR